MPLTDAQTDTLAGLADGLASGQLTGPALAKFLVQAGLLVRRQALTTAMAKAEADRLAGNAAAEAGKLAIQAQINAADAALTATL